MKKYIKMNNDNKQLSYGNLSKLIKQNSKNKNSALQTEIFCIIFGIENINDTTVNNYCIGIRTIHSDYKQIYLAHQKKYNKNKNVLLEIITNIYYLLNGNITEKKEEKLQINEINNNNEIINISKELFAIAKNDSGVTTNFINKLNYYIKEKNYFQLLTEILFYVILEKKQPVSENDFNKSIIENMLINTTIPPKDLENYLKLKFTDGINYDFKLNNLANENNAYACFELGMSEYKGYKLGKPRYDISLKYFFEAAKFDHPAACYMIANIFINKYGETSNKKELKKAYEFLEKSITLGNIAAINTKGIMYLNGTYPLEKDEVKAEELFKEAMKYDYAFAYNNLGKLEEAKNNYKKAYSYYLLSANLGESWAANKIGKYYIKKNNFKEALKYFEIGINTELSSLCSWNYYNLALYFYLKGIPELNIEKNKEKSIEYLTIAANSNNLNALIKLLEIHIDDYLETRNHQLKHEIKNIIFKIETNEKYNQTIKSKIESKIKSLLTKPDLNIQL